AAYTTGTSIPLVVGGTQTAISPITITSITVYFANSDSSIINGGIILKGSTDKTLLWSSNKWNSSEIFNLLTGKSYQIKGVDVLTSTNLGTGVLTSSLTSVGTLTSGSWTAGLIAGQYGGTGVANTGKTITIGGNLTTIGAFATTLTSTAATNVTLPTTGTLATLAGVETLPKKTISGVSNTITGLPNSALTNSAVLLGGQTLTLGAAATTTLNGMTSITSTTFVGALTGNCSGTALTVTQAAQPTITSLGTLTGLTSNGVINIVPVTAAYGSIRLDLGGVANSGFISFYGAGATSYRQGYIGFSNTNLATVDTGSIGYVAGTHAFTGALTSNSTFNSLTITPSAATLSLVAGSTLATAGAFPLTLTSTAATNVTLPTTGTLATLAGVET
ncbi:hypothetical protein HY310_02570, partial [Candidatus Microgenomates bacterium]|nr:hypothetical protein [Candidatus Microgenomates bacterium]